MPVFYSLITIDLIFGSGADSVKKSEILTRSISK